MVKFPMASASKKVRYFVEWAALATAFRTIPLVPRWFLRCVVVPPIAWLGYLIHSDGRRTAFANLEAAFPGRYSEAELEKLVKGCYRSWAQTYMDQFWTRRLNEKNYTKYLHYEIVDPEGLKAALESGSVCMTPHYGNFEWGAANMSWHGLHYTAIAQNFKNPRLTGIFRKNREHLGHALVPQEGAFLKLFRHLKKGGAAAFLPDLTVPPSQAATVIEMFGLKASVTLLGAVLVQRTGLPVLTGLATPRPDGTYDCKLLAPLFFPKDATLQEIAQGCWDVVEDSIAENPEHWLWMYKFFRFRPAEDGERYPAYANRSKKFDKLEKQVAEEAAKKAAKTPGDAEQITN